MSVYLEMPAAEYHRDPLERPSLSCSIAKILCTASPAHARYAHPKLNPDREVEGEEKFDIGTAAHALLLEGQAAVSIIDAPDWRTKAAQELRDAARADGLIPLLASKWADVQAMAAAAREQLAAHYADPPLFTDGRPEATLVWQEAGGVLCRARLDWLRDDFAAIDDLKTTSRSANPEQWSRSLFSMGFDLQAAWYLRGLKAVAGVDAEFRFAVQEAFPPYALSVVGLGPDVLTLARKKIDYALDLWRKCLTDDDWPAYEQRVCYAELPAYEEARWLEKEEMEMAA
jgi:hypothetical protein